MDPPCDLDLWYRMAEANYAVLSIDKPLMLYRVHDGSNSVNNTMRQRYMVHFVNYNMRLRRSGKDEITEIEFKNSVWSNWRYRAPRMFKDFYFTFYKRAANAYGKKRYINMCAWLGVCFALRPLVTITTIVKQKYT